MTRNIPLSLDESLLYEIDEAAEVTKETRSATMRRLMRLGLPLLKVQEQIERTKASLTNHTTAGRLASMPELKAVKRKARAGR